MANTITTRAIVDGANYAVIMTTMVSDGVAGEETDTVLFDASALTGAKNAANILWVDYMLSGFSARLEFDATTDTTALELGSDTPVVHDFRPFGGVTNNAGTGITGDITLTTTGFTAATDRGHIIMWVKKV